MGLEKHNEDFGQTFGRWGVAAGAVPGAAVPRARARCATASAWLDDVRRPAGQRIRPINLRNCVVLPALYLVSTRADLLDASRILEEAALDRYVFQRDAYLQRRRSLIYDGNPPREAARTSVERGTVPTQPDRGDGEPRAQQPCDVLAADAPRVVAAQCPPDWIPCSHFAARRGARCAGRARPGRSRPTCW